MMMVICSVFLVMSEREDAQELRVGIWQYLFDHSPKLYKKMRRRFLGRSANLNGRLGHLIIKVGYRISQKIFKFN